MQKHFFKDDITMSSYIMKLFEIVLKMLFWNYSHGLVQTSGHTA